MKRDMFRRHHSLASATLAAVCLVLALSVPVSAQEQYRVGPGDVLEIRFWQEPDFNAQVRVALDGSITLDIIGKVNVAGKTTEEIQDDIIRRISSLNRAISQAVVRVMEYNYRFVYVTGQVNSPGKYSFEAIPDLWSVINEAGGPTQSADLTRVTIIRGAGDDAGSIEVVNVAEAIASGQLKDLPDLERQDRVEIPQTVMGMPSQELGRTTEKRNVIYVMGSVNSPGPIQFEEDLDVLEAIALAGGPSTGADIEKTRVVTKDSYYAQSLHFNLEKYTASGVPSRYILRKEDAIYIPERRSSFLTTTLPIIGAAAGLVTTFLLIYDRVAGDEDTGGAAAP
ncbi:hypothetical protein GF420_11980 [candidate division GN15 bacterium]|nr:hypothetical protein [candidate division GN15 bacterium]